MHAAQMPSARIASRLQCGKRSTLVEQPGYPGYSCDNKYDLAFFRHCVVINDDLIAYATRTLLGYKEPNRNVRKARSVHKVRK